MSYTIDKIVHLSADHAERLMQLAYERGATEDAIIERALDLLFSLLDKVDVGEERFMWYMFSMRSLERVWDNDADAVYDNWRDIYGVSER